MKAIENEMLPKAIESINKNFNVVVQDLAETKNIVKALNDQLTVGEEEKKALELERDNLLKEKEISLHQLSLFTPEMNLKKFDVLKEVKDRDLVKESQMESSEEASDNETISKANDIEAPQTLFFLQILQQLSFS
ncbi:hypothetical protein JHK82_039510 [Glycine max]|nr:hypothetical protein JHK85_040274 [Glycine max]KAG5110287.1 hypothetical protein JHK82_039510 [Glycine max]KAG5121574.1 hypothetical protein JHK84_039914 [Glycine max]